MVSYYSERKKKSKKVKKNINKKSEIQYNYQDRCLDVNINFDKASNSWNKNKYVLVNENGFRIGYVYKNKK